MTSITVTPMGATTLDPQERRMVLGKLADEGPMSHEQLADELGFEWDHMQQIIRQLRKDGLVSITIDRRYEAESTPSTAPA